MGDDRPLVNIGMPVYNAEKFIRLALDSLLKQDYEHFELIISDNQSTDSTQEICLDYMARDKRIRYYRNDMNVGAIKNFNKVFELSRGEYFMWHAHDDYREPNYISSCLKIMEKNPNVILCCTDALLDENGGHRRLQENFSTIAMPLNRRFRKILWNNSCASIYGLMRSHILRKTGLLKSVFGPDNLLLAELSIMGEFFQLPLTLFKMNIRSGNIVRKVKAVFEAILPNDPRASFFPFTKLAIEHWKLVQNSRLKRKEKFIAFLDIILCFLLKYKVLLSDPVFTLYLNISKLTRKTGIV
jgi:glycosyltransferase involved in cell wall biosynthesis